MRTKLGRKYVVLLVVACVLFLGMGCFLCALPSIIIGVTFPYDAYDAAEKTLKADDTCQHCANIFSLNHKELLVTSADRLNGYEKVFCFAFSADAKVNDFTGFTSRDYEVFVYQNAHGQWNRLGVWAYESNKLDDLCGFTRFSQVRGWLKYTN